MEYFAYARLDGLVEIYMEPQTDMSKPLIASGDGRLLRIILNECEIGIEGNMFIPNIGESETADQVMSKITKFRDAVKKLLDGEIPERIFNEITGKFRRYESEKCGEVFVDLGHVSGAVLSPSEGLKIYFECYASIRWDSRNREVRFYGQDVCDYPIINCPINLVEIYSAGFPGGKI